MNNFSVGSNLMSIQSKEQGKVTWGRYFFFSGRDSGLLQIPLRLIHLQLNHDKTRPGISEHILLVCNTLSAGILITLSRYTRCFFPQPQLLTLQKCKAIISRNGGNNRISLPVRTLIYHRRPEKEKGKRGPSQAQLQACGMRSWVRNVDIPISRATLWRTSERVISLSVLQ